MASADGRSLHWNFILYPESAPENWRDIIDETHIEWVESPLHDKDVDPVGESKKEHYHVTLLYPSLKSFGQVSYLVQRILFQPIPISCKSVKGSIRYMVHKDNPDKFQYNWSDIVCHGGADLEVLCSASHSERLLVLKEILSFASENDITEYSDLVSIAIETGNNDWFNVITNFNTLAINAHVRSLRHKKKLKTGID